jgi:hypothetical protein
VMQKTAKYDRFGAVLPPNRTLGNRPASVVHITTELQKRKNKLKT